MKSAYELAMERLSKSAPSVTLTDEQKRERIAKRIALELREFARRLLAEGETSFSDFVAAERRYLEIRLEVTRSESDRVRFLEEELSRMKQLEKQAQVLFRNGQATQSDLKRSELARLDIEYALAKLRAKTRAAK